MTKFLNRIVLYGTFVSFLWRRLYGLSSLTAQLYLTIIRRRRSEYWWIFTNIHEPEANCFSIITQVIIEIPIKERNVKFYHNLQKFLKGKSDACKQLICIIKHVHFQVGVGVFSCQQIFTKISLAIFIVVVKKIEGGLAWTVFLSTTIQVITAVKICCETIDLFMHVDLSKIFTGI